MTRDPVRLFEDPATSAALRSDLGHAAADQVQLHGLDLVGGLARLKSATATVTASTTVVAGTSLLVKVGVGAGLAVGVALWLGLGATTPGSDEGDRVEAPVVARSPLAKPEPQPRAKATPEATLPHPAAPTPSTPAAVDVTPTDVTPTDVTPTDVTPAETADDLQDDPRPTEVHADPRPEPRHREARPRPTPAEPADPGSADSVLREAKLVAKARSNLARDPARALALADQAEHDFPGGQLVEDRKALAIRALVALGRTKEAEERAAPFLAEYGRGAHAAAVRRALAYE